MLHLFFYHPWNHLPIAKTTVQNLQEEVPLKLLGRSLVLCILHLVSSKFEC